MLHRGFLVAAISSTAGHSDVLQGRNCRMLLQHWQCIKCALPVSVPSLRGNGQANRVPWMPPPSSLLSQEQDLAVHVQSCDERTE